MRASKLYPFLIPANGSINLLVSGDYFKIKSATGSISVTGDSFGTLAGMLPGQGLRDTDYTRLTLTDETGAPNAGYILVSDGTFVDDRVTGEVSVIDGEKSRTIAGGQYVGTPYTVTPTAAQFPVVQLWNPSTNKNLIVTAISFSSTVASTVNVTNDTVARTTDQTATRAINKLMGAAIGVGQVRQETNAALPSNGGWGFSVLANNPTFWTIKGAIVVPPSKGLIIVGAVANSGLQGNFEWFEENVT